ncbi:MAG: sulfurtransferase [Acidobacteria bacterium]|nr:sulfurtransferase [Acidobacteriota bacterium]
MLSTALLAGSLGIASIVGVAEMPSNARILDARERSLYDAGHVPGSQHVDWKDWTLEKPGLTSLVTGNPANWGKLLADLAPLEARLRLLGLSNATPVVVVGTPDGWGEEGRVAWNLLVLGAANVALLDGGFPAWKAAGRPVERATPPLPSPGTFTVALRGERRARLEEVAQALRAGRPLLDARSPEEYSGKAMTGQKRGGHVPGARLVPEDRLYRPDGRYVTAGELRALIGLGEKPSGAPPITYCTGGVRSALLSLLIEARLGIVSPNYDGSMWEWSAREDLPLTTSTPGSR